MAAPFDLSNFLANNQWLNDQKENGQGLIRDVGWWNGFWSGSRLGQNDAAVARLRQMGLNDDQINAIRMDIAKRSDTNQGYIQKLMANQANTANAPKEADALKGDNDKQVQAAGNPMPNYPEELKRLQDQQAADSARNAQLAKDTAASRDRAIQGYQSWLNSDWENPFKEGNRGEQALESNVMGSVGNQYGAALKNTMEDAAARGINQSDPFYAYLQNQNGLDAARMRSSQIGNIKAENYGKMADWDTRAKQMKLEGMNALNRGDLDFLGNLQGQYNNQYQHAMQNPFTQYQMAQAPSATDAAIAANRFGTVSNNYNTGETIYNGTGENNQINRSNNDYRRRLQPISDTVGLAAPIVGPVAQTGMRMAFGGG